ncbi:hypothetical protein HJFPF1_02188 [Paramyrothecium foliicola]|nr:hypothetical protein HJFPF1_02188 [Paramyrothecium foliicola]
MSGLEALGLACNIFQVLSFAGETVSLCKAIYNGEATPDGKLQEKSQLMIEAANITAESARVGPSPNNQQLLDIAAKCRRAAEELQSEVFVVTQNRQKSQGSVVKTVRVWTKLAWNRKKLQRLDNSLQDYSKLMEATILPQICGRIQAMQLQQSNEIGDLSSELQVFISQIAAGFTRTVDLVMSEHDKSRTYFSRRISQSEMFIAQHVQAQLGDLGTYNATEKLNDRLLRSLKFPEMNQRYNDIKDGIGISFEGVMKSYEALSAQTTLDLSSHTKPELNTLETTTKTTKLSEIDAVWDDFIHWLESGSDPYWIQGKPGSGKSTLVKFLINCGATKLLLNRWQKDTEIISHFFWRIGSEGQNTLKGLLCSIAHQLLSRDRTYIAHVLEQHTYAASKETRHDWSVPELRSFVMTSLERWSRPLCLFIDALDEIASNGSRELMDVIQELQ